jgi:hypothetical protein
MMNALARHTARCIQIRVHFSSWRGVLFLLPVASIRLLGAAAAIHASLAAAAIHAWRFYGRHRLRQRSSRDDALFPLAVASLHRVCHTVAAATPSPPLVSSAPPKQCIFFCGLCFLRVYYLLSKLEADLWVFLISSAVPEGRASPPRSHAVRTQKFQFSPAAVSAESPPCSVAAFVVNSEPHTGASLGPFVWGAKYI